LPIGDHVGARDSIGLRREIGVDLLEVGYDVQVLAHNTPTPASCLVGQVLFANQASVLGRLIAGEVRHQLRLTQRHGVTINDKHAVAGTGAGDDLVSSTAPVDILAEHIAVLTRRAIGGMRRSLLVT
jgi:hypothetical protein